MIKEENNEALGATLECLSDFPRPWLSYSAAKVSDDYLPAQLLPDPIPYSEKGDSLTTAFLLICLRINSIS